MTGVSDAVRGPWKAVLTDQYGDPCDLDGFDDFDELQAEVAVVRGTAAPSGPGERRPPSYQGEDVLYEHTDIEDPETLALRWEQARAVAAALNAASGEVS